MVNYMYLDMLVQAAKRGESQCLEQANTFEETIVITCS
jgi:hypothetical protein